MSRAAPNPFVGQWQCGRCDRTFSRHFSRCAYCPTGDVVEDDWLRVMHELLIAEDKTPWAVEERPINQATVQPPAESAGQPKKERKWQRTIVRRADDARL